MAGTSLDKFFSRYVRGRDELEPVYNEILAGAGLRLEQAGKGVGEADGPVALDGARVTKETFEARIAEKKPGDTVRIAVFRSDDLRTFDIHLGARVDAPY